MNMVNQNIIVKDRVYTYAPDGTRRAGVVVADKAIGMLDKCFVRVRWDDRSIPSAWCNALDVFLDTANKGVTVAAPAAGDA